jgi:gluconate:H+ symporter, GntP family
MRFSRFLGFVLISIFLFLAQSPAVAQGVSESGGVDTRPIWLLLIGIGSVLAMIIALKLNAFLALIISALIVSLLIGGDAGSRMDAVVSAFGSSAGGIGIVIAMAAIIGKCMLDSGSADRIVRSAVGLTGEKNASLGLMFSGFVLAIPVFFDTVFYLLVPLARSLYKRTQKNYLRYIMAIATGGAITHTLVPPTPGPLLVAAILGVDVGMMMMIGTLVAFPTACIGLVYSYIIDRRMPIPMRPLGAGEEKHEPLAEDKLPGLWVSLLPVLLPVVLIGAGTLATTIADSEDLATIKTVDILDYPALANVFTSPAPNSPAARISQSSVFVRSPELLSRLSTPATTDADKQAVVDVLNQVISDPKIYNESAFLGVTLSDVTKSKIKADQLRMKPVDRRRMNRSLLEDTYPNLIAKHQWSSPRRTVSDSLSLWSNPNFALMLAALASMLTLKRVRNLSWNSLGSDVEESLMSGGIIILITAAGGAFGAMLTQTNISLTIQQMFQGQAASGIALLLLGWAIAAVLKIAQGSSTVAMIIGAGMVSAIMGGDKPEFHLVYVAIAVGAGSLLGSWMNDSGFWVFTKMGGLTEGESLRTWTPLLVVLSITSLLFTILFSQLLPMRVGS